MSTAIDVQDAAIDYLQSKRFLKIDTQLGEDTVLLTAVEGIDKVSSPFSFRVDLATRLADETILGLLGKPVTLWLANTNADGGREVNGLMSKLSGPGRYPRGFSHWQAEIVPQLAFLGYSADCRIFQNKTVVEIIDEVFAVHGLTDYRKHNLKGNYPVLDYCVQYRETALNFVSRLMEHNGLFYWHEHANGRHELVIADMTQAASFAMPEPLLMTSHDQFALIKNLTSDYTFRPGTWTLNDFNFESPGASLLASEPTVISEPPMASYEVFDYPGGYTAQAEGDRLSRVRAELSETKFHVMNGNGTAVRFDAGRKVNIVCENEPKLFFLVSVTHHARDMSHIALEAVPPAYRNEFSAVLTTYPFRPDCTAHKPFVQGPQTATVTGAPGEQIYTDEYGRVKVRFHWDRNPNNTTSENSSCWLRVSQIWADRGWGAIYIPRVGEEVIVGFLEGDPDQPIITGCVYNGDNNVPYALPANKTQSGIKSRSVPGPGSNEFRFEDKAGSEEIWLHAQKDFTRKVENNETINILGNLAETVNGTLNQTVDGAVSETFNDTLTQNVTNSITVTCPNVTFNVPTSMQIITPSTTEAKNSDITAGAYKLSAYGIGMNAYGAYLNCYGLKMDVTGFKIDLAIMAIKNAPLEFECIKTKIKVVDGWIKTAATKVESAATYIKDGAMYAITYAVVMFP
jgi:type VI secretion system secreted protein VgrG